MLHLNRDFAVLVLEMKSTLKQGLQRKHHLSFKTSSSEMTRAYTVILTPHRPQRAESQLPTLFSFTTDDFPPSRYPRIKQLEQAPISQTSYRYSAAFRNTRRGNGGVNSRILLHSFRHPVPKSRVKTLGRSQRWIDVASIRFPRRIVGLPNWFRQKSDVTLVCCRNEISVSGVRRKSMSTKAGGTHCSTERNPSLRKCRDQLRRP